MSTLRVLLFSLLGFIVPVVGSLFLLSTYYANPAARDLTAPADRIDEQGKPRVPKVITVGSEVAFAAVAPHPGLDAAPDEPFLVSFLVRFDELPEEGYRHNLVAKYSGSTRPYPGWAVGVHRRSTSLRLEVYWRDALGSGGWFPFDSVSLVPKKWYALSLVARPRQSLALFIQDIDTPFDDDGAEGRELRTGSRVKFVGGHDVSDVGIPGTDAHLVLGATRQGKEGFTGNVALVLIAHPKALASSAEEFRRALDGGPTHIVKKLHPEEISLWITERGTDESRFASAVELSGQATWGASQ